MRLCEAGGDKRCNSVYFMTHFTCVGFTVSSWAAGWVFKVCVCVWGERRRGVWMEGGMKRMKRSRVEKGGGGEVADGGVGSGAGLKVKTWCAEWWGFTGLYWEERRHASGRAGLRIIGHKNCLFTTKMLKVLFIKCLSCFHVFYGNFFLCC